MCPDSDAGRALVFTLDVITPIVDDPVAFGAIAAANSISDVYAMGGEPQVALSFVGMPEIVPLEMLEAILMGATTKAHEAGCAIVGGHSIRDSEPKLGLAVIGSVERAKAWTQRRARAGQKLVLTKAIGTGLVAQAAKSDRAEPAWVAEATRSMCELNRRARDVGVREGASSATDVTGFGLLGHLHHLAHASGLRARLEPEAVPVLPGALEAARAGLIPGGSGRNRRYVAAHLVGADRISAERMTILADAQTSGGLLLAMDAEGAERAVRELGAPACIVGELEPGEPGQIALS